jgi:apolipoprotein N-acyltransferase
MIRSAPRVQTAWGLWSAAAAGLLQAFAIAWPGSGQAHGWLQLLSLGWLAMGLAQLARADQPLRELLRLAAWRTQLFAVTWLAGVFWWLHVSMHEVGGMPTPLSVAAVLLLATALALYYTGAVALWLWLVRQARWAQRPLAASMLFAALWLLADLLRATWFTGFPWGAGGYAHVDGLLAVLAPWVGVYGMGAIAAALAMRLAWPTRRGQALLGWLLVWGLLHVWPEGTAWTRSAGTAEVELLQANISQTDKFEAQRGVREALLWYGERLSQSRAPLVIAPETAIPLLPRHLPPGYWQGLQNHFAQGQSLALVGLPWGDAEQGYANALVALAPATLSPYRYDKVHLVPFGEFVPTGFHWFVQLMAIPLGDFRPGRTRQAPIAWQGQQLAPNICYEDLFGEELAQRLVVDGREATALVNVSNIAWFGDTVAVDQHLNISRLRAMELGRPMLRATNTGATAIIDHRGQVQAMLPRFTRGSLIGTFEGRTGLTPYARWVSAWGLWPLWALALTAVALAGWAARRR